MARLDQGHAFVTLGTASDGEIVDYLIGMIDRYRHASTGVWTPPKPIRLLETTSTTRNRNTKTAQSAWKGASKNHV